MTIAAGIICADGVVLCADTQETFADYKVSRPKAFELKLLRDDVKVVVAGAGDSVFIDALRDKLEYALKTAKPVTASVRTTAEEVIINYCSMVWPLYATQRDRPVAEMLIGIRAPDGFTLLHSDGPLVMQAQEFDCVGIGSPMAIYQLKKIFRTGMTIEMACPAAICVLDIVKENVDGCGGPSDVFVIPLEGDVEHKDTRYVDGAVAAFKKFVSVSERLLARSTFLEPPLLSVLESLAEYIERWPEAKKGIAQFWVDEPKRIAKSLEEIERIKSRNKPQS